MAVYLGAEGGVMRNKLSIFFAVLLATNVAAAKEIDFDTVVTWNDNVLYQAVEEVGFNELSSDERRAKFNLMVDLLQKKSFSLRYATQVCLDKCAKSLEEARMKSVCGNVADALITVNNRLESGGVVPRRLENNPVRQADGTYKVYNDSGEFYALYEVGNKVPESLKQYLNICELEQSGRTKLENFRGVAFATVSNEPIALLFAGREEFLESRCMVDKYASYGVSMYVLNSKRASLWVTDWKDFGTRK